MDRHDTILALATPDAPAARAILRLSGPAVSSAIRAVFSADAPPPGRFAALRASLPGLHSPLPADVYFWRGPRSYTGQDVAEVHTAGCPPLVSLLSARLLESGCRPAGPGEFTLRAFLAGKLDLTRAEAVQAVIAATGRAELRQALAQLAGNVARPLGELREQLLDLLADVEAGLDFADEDIEFVGQEQLLLRLGRAMAQVVNVQKQLEGRAVAAAGFRVVLAGRPNAGKSSLFNALAGGRALVSPVPGTTRDYLTAKLELDGTTAELIDSPGWQDAQGTIEEQAQSLARRQLEEASLVLLCAEAGQEGADEQRASAPDGPPTLRVATKCDLRPAAPGWLATSAKERLGLADLRQAVAEAARRREEPALAPSGARCRAHVMAALAHLRAAHTLALENDPPELLALEVRLALDELGQLAGAVHTDDLLDRVFSRFCIGK